jgi:hypothetical protein
MTDVFSGYSIMFDNSANANNSTGGSSLPVNSISDSSYAYHPNYASSGKMIPNGPGTDSRMYHTSGAYGQLSGDMTTGAPNDDPNQGGGEFGEKRLETIHSGHFMVSEIDDTEGEPLDQSAENTESPTTPDAVGDGQLELQTQLVDNSMTEDQIVVESVYNPLCVRSASMIRIDNSLSKLFQCMSLAYESKLTSPKWKTFKGLKLKLRDKIRLNNMIWRAWHMQCECTVKSASDFNPSQDRPFKLPFCFFFLRRYHGLFSAHLSVLAQAGSRNCSETGSDRVGRKVLEMELSVGHCRVQKVASLS